MKWQHCLNNSTKRFLQGDTASHRGDFLLLQHFARHNKRLTLRFSIPLCSQGQLRKICSAACCVFLARVQSCWTPMALPSQRPRARPGVWRSCPVTQVELFCSAVVDTFVSYSWFLYLISLTLNVFLHVNMCLHAYVCVHVCLVKWELRQQVWFCCIPYQKCVRASVIVFVCTSLSFRTDLPVPVKGSSEFP